ncbi:MAG: NAD(P)H-dependent oxidoreductase [Peptostreptococcaceae bacterium]|nr:NAD(P)H-dependent oxidoreductase [Peptostreptococcaceae bacterium]
MLYVFCGDSPSDKLQQMTEQFCLPYSCVRRVRKGSLPVISKSDKILIAIDIDEFSGSDIPLLELIAAARRQSDHYFAGAVGAILCCGFSMLYTKTFASKIAFLCNGMGLAFIGKPVVEALLEYRNFMNKQKQLPLPLKEICLQDCKILGERLSDFRSDFRPHRITAVHTSRPEVSNTHALMNEILSRLSAYKTTFSLHGKSIMDCRGCLFNQCLSLSSKGRCYYSEDILDEVFRDLVDSDSLMIACPNYNDSMPANYFAMVNRMTYIYRSQDLSQKSVYAIIVSSNSGSDMVAAQVISAFCFNKGFRLPPYFALTGQACDPLSILSQEGIEASIEEYASRLRSK